jgi:hypothetical protein
MRSPAAGGLLLGVALLAGCEVFPGVAPAGPLVTVETLGGHCVRGSCGGTVAIERDGRVHATAPQAAELARLPEPVRFGLEQAVANADFTKLKSRPFPGECPVNFDGQELIYTFTAAAGPVRLASCEVEIDPADPLFAAVEAALAVNRQ